MTLLALLAACTGGPIPADDSVATARCPIGGSEVGIEEGDCAPEFALPDRDGEIVALTDFRGKVALVDISAVW